MLNFPSVMPADLNAVLTDLAMQAVLDADDAGPEMTDAEAAAVLELETDNIRSGLWFPSW